MELIPESVSEREAEALYPTQYWEGTRVKKILDLDTDALQDAYMRGREAEPCAEQIEAVADKLKELMTEESITAFFDTLDDWEDTMTDEQVEAAAAKHFARLVLEAARKAVM